MIIIQIQKSDELIICEDVDDFPVAEAFKVLHLDYKVDFFRRKLLNCGLHPQKIEQIENIIEETCHNCWENDRSCQCANDE